MIVLLHLYAAISVVACDISTDSFILVSLEAIASKLGAIAIRLEAIASTDSPFGKLGGHGQLSGQPSTPAGIGQ